MDRASYEAGFRAAQEQNLQQPSEQGNQFLDAVGKTALGLGVAAGAGIAGRRLLRGRGFGAQKPEPRKQYTRREKVEQDARTALNELQSRTGSLQTGVKLPLVSELTETTPAQVTLGLATPGSGFRKFSQEAEKIRPEDFTDRFIRENRADYLKAKERQQELLEAGEIGRESQRQARAIETAEAQNILAQLKEEKALGTATPGSGFQKFSQEAEQLKREAAESNFANEYLVKNQYVDANASEQLVEEASVTSVQKQQMAEGQVATQSLEAIDTAADQEAMRVSRTVQRDPGENLAEFEQLQDQLEQRGASPVQAADTAVAITEGNEAFTQIDRPLNESSASRFLANERDEIASQLAEQGLLITPGRIEKELGNRLGSEAYKYGPEYTQLKQNIQLGATYDPELFDNPNKPSVRIAGEEVPTGRVPATKLERTPYTNELIAEDVELGLRQPTYMEETAQRLQEQAEKKRDWLGSVRLEEASKNAKLNAELINTNRQYNRAVDFQTELNDFLDSDKGTLKQRERAQILLDDVGYELDRLDVRSEQLNQRIYGGQSGARVRGAEKFTEDYIASLTPSSRLKPGVEEGQRLYFEVDPNTGDPIPGTQELRAEKYEIDTDLKSGGGRLAVEFDPEGQSGQAKDIYGIRQSSSLRDDPKKRPSEPRYTKAEIADEAMRLSSASPEGDVPVAPDYEEVIESLGSQPKTEASRRSVLMSEAIRKATREKANRNPRGGKIPGELETLRRSMPEITAVNNPKQDIDLWTRSSLPSQQRTIPASSPPRQRTIPGTTVYDARQRRSQADIAAQQLESYMKSRMTGRSTPLTSEVVIQPKLF